MIKIEEVIEKITEKIISNSTKEKLVKNLKENRDGVLLWISGNIDQWLSTLILDSEESFLSVDDLPELIESMVCKLEEKCC
ncbi:MAG: hypothetical protein KAJ58_00680 [Candidatus Pacebacteria bacterium]|nr:hypothetical protein [Candidatus Paceibacterota bacterium]